ncbi:AAA family ATPase [Chryseobacterium sp. R2ACT005]|uniref:AAA family ATPase n=1 Tax=Chryseobacterium sp. R2ACT005 TaxID=3416668 RepID=UPI003CEB1783
MKKGFIFTELRLCGDNVQDAIIRFTKGLNVISGPSNTGKTLIFECIDYMLGSSDKPKSPGKVKQYSKIFLELKSEEEYYTLESGFTSTSFNLYKCKINEIHKFPYPEVLKKKHNSKSSDNISQFLLKLNNISDKRIRKNKKGNANNLSYRNLIKFSLIDEARIMTKNSPIYTHYMHMTEESNVFKYIITGKDDSSVSVKLSSDEIARRKGKIEILKNIIVEADYLNLEGYKLEEINEQLSKIEKSLKEHQQKFDNIRIAYLDIEDKYKTKSIELIERQGALQEITELFKRSSVLEKQYFSDIDRLKSTIEASSFLSNSTTHSCPVCHNEIDEKIDEISLNAIEIACENEINKIHSLLNELSSSRAIIINEKESLQSSTNLLGEETNSLKQELSVGIGVELNEIIEIISRLSNKKSQLLGIKDNLEKSVSYENTISSLEESLPNDITKDDIDTITESNITPLCKKMTEILKGINIKKNVSFNIKALEFEIEGELRNVFGKGYRAIYYAVFITALQELLLNKDYAIGVPVLDSPLVTYRKPDSEGEGIDEDLAMNFYRYIAKSNIEQFIIIENEEPPSDIKEIINHIKFSGLKGKGRFGFIP